MRPLLRVVLAGVLIVACGKSVVITEPGPPPASQGTVNAVVDGAAWSLQVWPGLVAANPLRCRRDCLLIRAKNAYYFPADTLGISIELFAFDTTGATPASLAPNGPNRAVIYVGPRTWVTTLSGGSGTVAVTTLDATGASGTFSLTAAPDPFSGATGLKQVTNGSFTVTF
jgi:hypothetical protein